MSKYGVFSGPYFPVFRMNMEIHYQSKYRKIQKGSSVHISVWLNYTYIVRKIKKKKEVPGKSFSSREHSKLIKRAYIVGFYLTKPLEYKTVLLNTQENSVLGAAF